MPPTPSNRAGRAPEGTFHRTWGAPPQHSVSAQRPPHAIPTSGAYAPSGAARATPPRAPIRQHHVAHARRPPRAGRRVGAACDASWARRGGARSARHGQHTPCQLATYTHTCSMTLRRPESQTKAGSTLGSSRAVPHPSTNRALRRLTSEVRRDPVHSTRYGRQRKTSAPFGFNRCFVSPRRHSFRLPLPMQPSFLAPARSTWMAAHCARQRAGDRLTRPRRAPPNAKHELRRQATPRIPIIGAASAYPPRAPPHRIMLVACGAARARPCAHMRARARAQTRHAGCSHEGSNPGPPHNTPPLSHRPPPPCQSYPVRPPPLVIRWRRVETEMQRWR